MVHQLRLSLGTSSFSRLACLPSPLSLSIGLLVQSNTQASLFRKHKWPSVDSKRKIEKSAFMQTDAVLALLLLFAGNITPYVHGREHKESCNTVPISHSVSVPTSVGVVSDLVFTRQQGFSEATISFTNASARTVQAVFANIELRNKTEQRLMTIPANVTQSSGQTHEKWPVRISGLQEYRVKAPIEPGARVQLYGYNPRTIGFCPSDAVLSYLKIVYTDGTNVELHLPDWYSDSVPYKVPENVRTALQDRIFSAVVKVTISVDGKVHLSLPGELSSEQRSYLQGILDSWIFLPATNSGTPTESVVVMFVSRGPCKKAAISRDGHEGIRVDICPRRNSSVEEV